MIIICAFLVGPTSPMLHTKFQGHRPPGSGEEEYKGVYFKCAMVASLFM